MQTLEQINDQLKQPLNVARVCKRDGAGKQKLSYLETYDVIEHLNRVFGFDGWQCRTNRLTAFPDGAPTTCFVASVTLTLRFGDTFKSSAKALALERCEAAVTNSAPRRAESDALKRAARTLGDQFGNSLYEKDAPEHKGQQRARIATQEQLTECETLRGQAVKLGLLAKSGNPPLIAQDGAEERIVLAKTKAYRDYIQEHGDKGAIGNSPPTNCQTLRRVWPRALSA